MWIEDEHLLGAAVSWKLDSPSSFSACSQAMADRFSRRLTTARASPGPYVRSRDDRAVLNFARHLTLAASNGLAQVWQRLSQIGAQWLQSEQSATVKNLDSIWVFWPPMVRVCAWR